MATTFFGLSIPISIVVVTPLLTLTILYWQTIYVYPGGGGAHIVARENERVINHAA